MFEKKFLLEVMIFVKYLLIPVKGEKCFRKKLFLNELVCGLVKIDYLNESLSGLLKKQ